MLRGVATYAEIRQNWDLNDVMRANEHLDVQDDAEWLAHEEAKRKQRRSAGRR